VLLSLNELKNVFFKKNHQPRWWLKYELANETSSTEGVCFSESSFWKIIFQTFMCLFVIGKLVNGKHFLVKEKFGLVSRKVFSFYFGRKTLSESCEKFRNVIFFADYIKFGPQTFDCYIYIFFVLNIFFSISSLII
jgi:hypothetical protein